MNAAYTLQNYTKLKGTSKESYFEPIGTLMCPFYGVLSAHYHLIAMNVVR